MNRRGFFRSLVLLAGAASVSPTIFIPKFEPVKWKVASPAYWLNPEWVRAPYEMRFFYGSWRWTMENLGEALSDYSPRAVFKDGRFVVIHPFLKI